MDNTLSWHLMGDKDEQDRTQPNTSMTARYGSGSDEGPVLIVTVSGPVEAEMAEDALKEAGIPVFIKRNSLGAVYGLSVGSFGAAEVWVPHPLAERARDILIGIGMLEPSEDDTVE
jgi:hypothetical protein